MCIRLTVQFLCSREDVHKCSGLAKKPRLQLPGDAKYSLDSRGIPRTPEGDSLLEDALAFEEDGIMPCGKVSCVVDQATFDALPREWLRCYKGRCNSCLMQAVRLEMTCDPEYEEWFCTKSEPSLRLREEHAGMLFKEFQSQQRIMFEKYLKFPLLNENLAWRPKRSERPRGRDYRGPRDWRAQAQESREMVKVGSEFPGST